MTRPIDVRLLGPLTPRQANACDRAIARSDQLVYFIQAVHGGPIKIGIARNPVVRLAELQVGNPSQLRILKCIPGGLRKEIELHRRFHEHRLCGEWFRPVEELCKLCRGEPADDAALAEARMEGFLEGCSKMRADEDALRAEIAGLKDELRDADLTIASPDEEISSPTALSPEAIASAVAKLDAYLEGAS